MMNFFIGLLMGAIIVAALLKFDFATLRTKLANIFKKKE
jgi:hypothetical protein